MKRLLWSGLLLASVAVVYAKPRPIENIYSPQELKPSASPGFSSLKNDTIYFGGTRWAADSMRWEAIKDSVWTFDTGVGSFIKGPGQTYPNVDPYKPDGFHGGMEGWTGWDLTASPVTFFRRLSSDDPRWQGSACVGAAAGFGGTYSYWVGVFPAESDSLCFATGKGYGNAWHVCLEHSFDYSGGPANLSFAYRNDTESGFDYTHVYCDTAGSSSVEITSFTGAVSGTASLPLTQGIELPRVPKPIKIKFCFDSDGAWSDQDGLNPTDCGAFALDDVSIQGAITHSTDFESSNDGWVLSPYPAGLGKELSNLVAQQDLPALSNPLPGQCTLRDSVLVFYDPGTLQHPTFQNNVAISPWIDLGRAGITGRRGRTVILDGYFDLPLRNYLFVKVLAQWYPDTCRATGKIRLSDWSSNGFVYYFGNSPVCGETKNSKIDFSEIVPPNVQNIRIAVGVENYCPIVMCEGGSNNSTPWFDNLRFATYSFTTIQAAIDQASPGDTVWVPPGAYDQPGNVNLTFRGKNIVLKSAAGAEHTIIDGSARYRGLRCEDGEDSTAAVIGFTFQNCAAPYDSGGAVYIGSGVSARFEDCTFATSTARYGAGISARTDAHPSFSRCLFKDNAANSAGGGAFFGGGRFVDCTFEGNTSSFSGGGISMPQFSGSSEFIRVTIRDTKEGGGAVLEGDAHVENCVFENNQGGGLKFRGRGLIHDSSFIGNQGRGLTFNVFEGYGVPPNCVSLTHVSNCRVIGNSEGGIFGCGGNVDSTLVQGNKNHGGISTEETHISHCTIIDNVADYGGGVRLESGVIEDCVISGNTAQYGGGISGYVKKDYRRQTFRVQNCLISGNVAERGGGLWIHTFDNYYQQQPYISGSSIVSNRATLGGGIFQTAETPVRLERCILWGNEAVSGAEVLSADTFDHLQIICCDVDSTGIRGHGSVTYEGPQVFSNPFFCKPALASNTPTSEGDYTLAFDSPCLPVRSPCDSLIGALSEGCDVVSVLPPSDPQEPPFLKTPGIHAGPNPFTQALTIHYLSPNGTDPRLEIYSVDGRLIGKWALRPGSGVVNWDGRDPIGKPVASGIYLVRYIAGDLHVVQRVVRITW